MHTSKKLWIRTALFGIVLFLCGYVYNSYQTSIWNVYTANKALAFSAILLVDLSFVISGTSYFWGIGKKYMGYRKSIGVIGFIFGLLHAFFSAWLFTGTVFWINLIKTAPLAYIPAVLAVIIFTMMVGVSNWGMPRRIGAKRWRQLLRVGYAGIFLLVIHIGIVSIDSWVLWIENFYSTLPPLSLLVVIFSLFTLGMRIALWYSLENKKISH